jgi:RHS repeat-associated protein
LNNGAVTYVYDGDGNRVSKTVSGVTTNYLVDTNNHTGYAQVVEELQNNAVVKQFTYGHDLISQRIIGGPLSFYGYDGHGSVRQLTDASAAITDTYDYDAFGLLLSRTGTTPNDYLYSGEQFDEQLGFQYLRARYMNPSSGRFVSMDTYEGLQSDPVTLHKYLYGDANPVNRLDFSGHETTTVETLITVGILTTLVAMTAVVLQKVVEEIYKETITIRVWPRPTPTPTPQPSPIIDIIPPPVPTPDPTPDPDPFVNLDASTAVAMTMETHLILIRYLQSFADDKC